MKRVQKQKETPITVIIGNPPYSVGQKSANDNAQNQKYENLDRRIAETYAKESKATNFAIWRESIFSMIQITSLAHVLKSFSEI